MKIILLTELRGKGGEGDVIDVAQGYAENYLFPNRMALPATKGNLKQLEERRHNIAKREERRVADAEALKAAIDGKSVQITDVRVGDEGQLFGSVTATMVADAIKAQLGTEVDRRRVMLNRAIKTSGMHPVTVNLYRAINATVNALVGVTEEELAAEEAEIEAEEAAAEAVAEVEEAAAEVAEEATEE